MLIVQAGGRACQGRSERVQPCGCFAAAQKDSAARQQSDGSFPLKSWGLAHANENTGYSTADGTLVRFVTDVRPSIDNRMVPVLPK